MTNDKKEKKVIVVLVLIGLFMSTTVLLYYSCCISLVLFRACNRISLLPFCFCFVFRQHYRLDGTG